MYHGIISRRYASALWLYAKKNGQEDRVYAETKRLGSSFVKYTALKRVLSNHSLSKEKKLAVVLMIAGENISDVFKKFIRLVYTNRREEFIQTICLSYEAIYLKEKKILKAGLITVIPVENGMEQRIIKKIEEGTAHTIHLNTAVNPSILGGCIITVDTWRLDASVTTQLKRIKESLIETAINF